ncbi:MAG: flagellar hook-basal body complex protein [Lachnospiraceae bacterium]
MFRGFYSLTSEMICQNRNLNVISNNMANVSTPGYRSDKFLSSTFKEEMLYRSGNKDKRNQTALGEVAMIRTGREVATDYSMGGFESTEGVLDFALQGKGFFEIQTNNGTVYTRDGSFMIDNDGYLALSGIGRVMGSNGPIRLGTDDIVVDAQGNIYDQTGQTTYGRIAVVDFADYNQLTKQDNGMFTSGVQGTPVNTPMLWKYIEKANVGVVNEMTSMMSGQRSLQSAAQVLKMYDQLMGKIVSEIGRV